jgi:hypothetical protein
MKTEPIATFLILRFYRYCIIGNNVERRGIGTPWTRFWTPRPIYPWKLETHAVSNPDELKSKVVLVSSWSTRRLKHVLFLFEDAIYDGIYRDDGLVVFRGNWSKSKITEWLEKFQEEVNKVTRYDGQGPDQTRLRATSSKSTKRTKA